MKESILKRFPGLGPDDIVLRDDGNGIYIDVWKSEDQKPKMADVMAWVAEDKENYIPELTDDEKFAELEIKLEKAQQDNADLNLAIIEIWETFA